MQKTLRKLMALALALVLILPATAFAEGELNLPIKKTLTTTESKENLVLPEMTFRFNLVGVDNTSDKMPDGKTPLYKGDAALLSLSADSVVFNNESVFTGNKSTAQTSATIDSTVLAQLTPGVYRYELSELPIEPAIDGLSGDTTKYIIDVYVFLEAGVKKTAIVSYKDAAPTTAAEVESMKAAPEFGSAEGEDGTNTYTTNPVKVTKVIAGNGADMAKKFTFTIVVNGAVGEQYIADNGEVFSTGVAKEVQLGHNESIEIYGLSATDSYTVSEDNENYEQTVEGELTGSIGNARKDITVTNTLNTTIPTGIIETITPFVIMIAAALLVGFVYFRRREEA